MVSKAKIVGGAALVASGVLVVASMVGAQTAALSASCNNVVSGNTIAWTATSTGGNPPYVFLWSGDSSVAGSTSTSIVATYSANGIYTANVQATDASSTVATSTCLGTVTSIVTVPTSTPSLPHSFVKKPMLSIGENGRFLARGMTVTSVSSGSFQAQVWGIAFTVNWSGNLAAQFEFYYRFNKATSTPAQQLAVGDEVGVSGMLVSSSSPLTVNANVVRDYSITVQRPQPQGWGWGLLKGNVSSSDMNGENESSSGKSGNGNGGYFGNFRNQLNGFMKQFENLQKQWRSRFGQ
jgi:hypothetical protein